jgi:hypothetical protein
VTADQQRTADALVFGVITYGAFLENAEPVIRHGVEAEALALVRAYFWRAGSRTDPADSLTSEPEHPQERI